MGLTCANVHVFAPGLSAAADVDKLMDIAGQRLGCERVENEADADRALAVLHAPPWLTILDPASAGAIEKESIDLAKQFSASSGGPVLIASVHDSDFFSFLLFEKGKQVDGYTSSAEFFQYSYKKWSLKKRAQEWSRCFGQPLNETDLREITRPSGLFADDSLLRLCSLLGIPANQGAMTVSDLDRPQTPAVTRYRFRLRAGGPAGGAGVTQLNAPSPKIASDADPIEKLTLLKSTSWFLHFELSSGMEGFHEPVLEIAGSAVDQGLLEVKNATGLWYRRKGNRPEEIRKGTFHLVEEQVDGRRVVRAKLAGMSAPRSTLKPNTPIVLSIDTQIRGSVAGAGELRLILAPSAESTKRVALWPAYQTIVVAPRWVPLGFDREGALPFLVLNLKKLNCPTILSGVVIVEEQGEGPRQEKSLLLLPSSIDAPVEKQVEDSIETLERVRPLLEHWLTVMGARSPSHVRTVSLGQMNPASFNIPKKKSVLPVAEIGTGKKWLSLFRKSKALLSLFVEVVDEQTGKPRSGAAVQRAWGDTRETLHVSFWVDAPADGAATGVVNADREFLTELIDAAFSRMTGLQGWVAHWDWVPRFSTGDENEYTPYEDVYSLGPANESTVGAGGFMMRAWCSRYLRGLSERLWLGKALRARISEAELASVARTTAIGPSALRLDLLPGLGLNPLEMVLRPILPSTVAAR